MAVSAAAEEFEARAGVVAGANREVDEGREGGGEGWAVGGEKHAQVGGGGVGGDRACEVDGGGDEAVTGARLETGFLGERGAGVGGQGVGIR